MPVRINPWESYLRGWFIAKDQTVGILVNGEFIPAAYGLPRPDVASHFSDADITNCGFHVKFCPPRKKSRIKLVAQSKSKKSVLAEIEYVPEPDPEAALFWPKDEVQRRLAELPYQPSISIVMSKNNPDRFLLDRCVQSIQKQHYPNWQLNTLDEAEGELIVMLDQHDELHPAALLELIRCLNAHSDCEVVYSDEDKLDVEDSRCDPIIKPDFDPEMLLAFNYIGRLAAFKRTTLEKLEEYSSEWDLLIRILDKVGPGGFQHIPKILYHRRIAVQPGPTHRAWEKTLTDHVIRTGKSAVVEPGIFEGSMRLKYVAPKEAQVAVFFNPEDDDFQLRTLRSVQNKRRQISLYPLSEFAAQRPSADVFVFINRPLESINHFFFEELTAQALRADCGLVTGVSNPNDNLPRSVDTISAGFFAVRREHVLNVGVAGPLDQLIERLLSNAKQRGLRILVTPYAVAQVMA